MNPQGDQGPQRPTGQPSGSGTDGMQWGARPPGEPEQAGARQASTSEGQSRLFCELRPNAPIQQILDQLEDDIDYTDYLHDIPEYEYHPFAKLALQMCPRSNEPVKQIYLYVDGSFKHDRPSKAGWSCIIGRAGSSPTSPVGWAIW